MVMLTFKKKKNLILTSVVTVISIVTLTNALTVTSVVTLTSVVIRWPNGIIYEHDTHLCAVDISSANDFGFPPVKASSMAFRLAEAWI